MNGREGKYKKRRGKEGKETNRWIKEEGDKEGDRRGIMLKGGHSLLEKRVRKARD